MAYDPPCRPVESFVDLSAEWPKGGHGKGNTRVAGRCMYMNEYMYSLLRVRRRRPNWELLKNQQGSVPTSILAGIVLVTGLV